MTNIVHISRQRRWSSYREVRRDASRRLLRSAFISGPTSDSLQAFVLIQMNQQLMIRVYLVIFS